MALQAHMCLVSPCCLPPSLVGTQFSMWAQGCGQPRSTRTPPPEVKAIQGQDHLSTSFSHTSFNNVPVPGTGLGARNTVTNPDAVPVSMELQFIVAPASISLMLSLGAGEAIVVIPLFQMTMKCSLEYCVSGQEVKGLPLLQVSGSLPSTLPTVPLTLVNFLILTSDHLLHYSDSLLHLGHPGCLVSVR